ncbi:MAG TPA: hypothetical protein VJG32_08175 [Anaerolineae bacterium]|nr:hypothetical protein [Anaerolineae bacterium]
MSRKLILLAVLSLLVSAVTTSAAPVHAAHATAFNSSNELTSVAAQSTAVQWLQGTLIAIRRPYGTVTFQLSDGTTPVLNLSRSTIIFRNGWLATAHKLKVGDSAQATYLNGTVLGISAVGP